MKLLLTKQSFLSFVIAVVAILAVHITSAQIVSDNFNDGDFTTGTLWEGTTDNFIVNPDAQLQLNDDVAAQSYLTTSFTSTSLDNKEWRIWVKQSFAGSDNNQSRIYIAASGNVLSYSGSGTAGVQGYFLKLGEAGTADVIKFCRDDGAGSVVELMAGTTNISSSVEMFIKVIRDGAGNWNMYSSDDGVSYSLEATVNDTAYSSCTTFGMVCTYTASNADNFFFDDIYFGDIVVDTTPPEIISATATSSTTVDVLFNEQVDELTGETSTFYTIAGIGTATNAARDDVNNALVHLTFGTAFTANVTSTLQEIDVEDLNGNSSNGSSADFMWFVPATASFRNVVFNEVFADPTPVVGLPDAEFVELFNAGDEAFDLSDWQFVNSTTAKTLPSFALAPGAFVVLCEDDFVTEFPDAIGISSFTALSNEGDSLTLIDNNGNIIDILVYSVDWFDTPEKSEGGWTLEQINPALPCMTASNWSESQNINGGTPAAQNSVFNSSPDVVAPTVVAWGIADLNHIYVQFSETMDTTGYSSPSWEFIPFSSVFNSVWNSALDGVTMEVQFPLNPPGAWQLFVNGISDCSGNEIQFVTLDFFAAFSPQVGDIIINEIMPDPDPPILMPNAEYVELYNKSLSQLDLKGVMLNDEIIDEQVLIEPNDYIIIADQSNAVAFLAYDKKVFIENFSGLTNTGATLTLKDADGNILDEVSYTDQWYHDINKNDGGWSLELINPNDPCSNEDNWRASVDSRGGTAGEVNSVLDETPDSSPPQLLYVLNEPQEHVTLVFDEPIDESSLAGLSWTVNGEVFNSPSAFLWGESSEQVIIQYGEMEAGMIYAFELFGLNDCWSNSAGLVTGQFALGQEPEVGGIIINEILFNPFDGGYDFVEIYNRSVLPISLADWRIANGENNVPDVSEIITELNYVLLPGEYLVLTADGSLLPEFYPFTKTNRIWEVESLPTYNVQAGEVFLLMPTLATSDYFTYNDAMHFALLNSNDGVSLERIDAFRPSDDDTNWHSAAESQGFATPGYINSQTFFGDFNPEGISIEPEIFSPDNDGYNDVVTIHYSDDTPGLVANIYIFDSEGREIRHLTKNELLGTNTSVSWDGTTDEKQLAPIGIYIIYFEVFSTDGTVMKHKETCVLAHKLN
ncbi:MAG: lamin tail domain-containing protein [Flavobacteriales bacterium]|nr:lamin tail domain-containing protein [Flavobacteriales bacterium]